MAEVPKSRNEGKSKNLRQVGTPLVLAALIIGATGLGLGAYGVSGLLAGKPPYVAILNPSPGDEVAGNIIVRAMVTGAESGDYTVIILRNGTQVGTSLPFTWDTTGVADGWYNLTIIVTGKHGIASDQVIVQVLNNPEQDPVYYCASQTEITADLAIIGAGVGRIIITQNITLTNTIMINGGGSYLIEGVAPGVTVDCDGNQPAFSITSAASCTIRDLSVDARDLSGTATGAINVAETSVNLENIRIFGDSSSSGGIGILVNGGDVWISNCYISETYCGVYLYSDARAVSISGNRVSNTSYGIYITIGGIAGEITCQNNVITSSGIAIYMSGANNTIAGNILQGNENGIRCYTTNSTYTGNTIVGVTSIAGANTYGIRVGDESSSNVFTGNAVSDHRSSDYPSHVGYGIYIHAGAKENVITGNAFLYNDVNEVDLGTNNILSGNNNDP